jgi:hypothetical protein
MVSSRKGLNRSIKVPTLEDWAKAKEQKSKTQAHLPFIQKLRILDRMRQNVRH